MTLIAVVLSAAMPGVSACPVPTDWATAMPRGAGLQLLSNVVRFNDGVLRWNGVPISEKQLALYLRATKTITPQPRLLVDINPRHCAALSRIVAAVQRAGVDCGHGKCVATHIVDPPPPLAPFRPTRRH